MHHYTHNFFKTFTPGDGAKIHKASNIPYGEASCLNTQRIAIKDLGPLSNLKRNFALDSINVGHMQDHWLSHIILAETFYWRIK
jgi:hypothetical protein